MPKHFKSLTLSNQVCGARRTPPNATVREFQAAKQRHRTYRLRDTLTSAYTPKLGVFSINTN